ncbi:MAG: DUF362 domain-containing protein [Candidatus Caldatribacteriota bacterium]|nr:DUF362 domain-containing protein [Candidatus Caldatribacteriota bacterium]
MTKVLIRNTKKNKISEIVTEIFDEYDVRSKVFNKTVLIKPNLIGSFPPERGVTTDPRVVAAIVKELKKCNTKEIVVGDNSGSIHFDPMKIAKVTGMLKASDGCFINIGSEVEEVEVKSKFIKNLFISKKILHADYIINVPKFKTHSLTTITGAIKNMFGIIPGGKKAQLHTISHSIDEFAELLVDIYQIRVPDLNIMDAIIGMEGMGPTNGKIREINKIISSDNGVSVDSVMSFMMGLNPNSIELLKISAKRNLGEIDTSKIVIDGTLEKIPEFKTPNNGLLQKIIKVAVPHIFNFAAVKPIVDHNKCKICKKCIEVCPTGAMSIKDKYPEVDRKKCISCFCCDEHCPYGAITLPSWQKDMFNRLMGK